MDCLYYLGVWGFCHSSCHTCHSKDPKHTPCVTRTARTGILSAFSNCTVKASLCHKPTSNSRYATLTSFSFDVLHTVSKSEDGKHTVQRPWEYFWQFVWKFFSWVNQLLQQISGCLVSDERAEEEAECAAQGSVWFRDDVRPVGCPVRCTSLVELYWQKLVNYFSCGQRFYL